MKKKFGKIINQNLTVLNFRINTWHFNKSTKKWVKTEFYFKILFL